MDEQQWLAERFEEHRSRLRAVGYRMLDGKEVPVLNALQLLERSPFGTFVARVKMASSQEAIEQLTELAVQRKGYAENWTESVRFICKACSEGRPHAEHDTQGRPPKDVHQIAIAARDRDHATAILRAWETGRNVQVEWLADPPEPPPSA